MNYLKYLIATVVLVLLIAAPLLNTRKKDIYLPPKEVTLKVMNSAPNRVRCTLNDAPMTLSAIDDTHYAFCTQSPAKVTCLYLKEQNVIHVRSRIDSDCKNIELAKRCFIINDKTYTCVEQKIL